MYIATHTHTQAKMVQWVFGSFGKKKAKKFTIEANATRRENTIDVTEECITRGAWNKDEWERQQEVEVEEEWKWQPFCCFSFSLHQTLTIFLFPILLILHHFLALFLYVNLKCEYFHFTSSFTKYGYACMWVYRYALDALLPLYRQNSRLEPSSQCELWVSSRDREREILALLWQNK